MNEERLKTLIARARQITFRSTPDIDHVVLLHNLADSLEELMLVCVGHYGELQSQIEINKQLVGGDPE